MKKIERGRDSNGKIPVFIDLEAASSQIRRPSQPIRKVLPAAWKLIRLGTEKQVMSYELRVMSF
jgi:hypothetical protein